VDGFAPELIHELFMYVQPAHLQKVGKKLLEPDERDTVRAEYIRTRLPSL
jgi:protein-arginine kinase